MSDIVKGFLTIKENVQAEIVEKKSKFIANLFYIENIEEAEKIIKETRKKYFDARHNCIAYRVIEDGQIIERFSDDGEPSGTAGLPILYVLDNNLLNFILCVVIRYFGGIKLGTGGLVRAYSDSLTLAIEKSIKIEKRLGNQLEVIVDYSELDNFKYYCRNNKINLIESTFEEKIICKIEMENDKKEKLIEDFNTKKVKIIEYKELCKKYITKCI